MRGKIAALSFLFFSGQIALGADVDGYKNIPWGSTYRTAKSTLQPKKGVWCDKNNPAFVKMMQKVSSSSWDAQISRKRDPIDPESFQQALHAIKSINSVALLDQPADGRLDRVKGAIDPILYGDSYENKEKIKYFRAEAIGPGCGLFFNDQYFGQVNIVNEELSEKLVLDSLTETLGPPKFLREEDRYNKNSGGSFRSHEFLKANTNAYLLFDSDRVITAYFSVALLEKIPQLLVPLLEKDRLDKQKKDDEQRKKATKKVMSDL